MRDVRVHLLPTLFEPAELRGGLAVVVDLLRASTTIVHALGAGAESVIPCLEVDDARTYAANHSGAPLVLGGERGGALIEGFDLDNSPRRYTREAVQGRRLVFTTTNGTRALLRSAQADRIFVGAFANLSGLLTLLVEADRPVHLVCAGTRGQVTAEDVLCAGALATGLAAASENAEWDHDAARLAMDFYQAHATCYATYLDALRRSLGGRDLLALGYDADIERCAEWDRFDLVPEFLPSTGEICAVRPQTTDARRWVAQPPG